MYPEHAPDYNFFIQEGNLDRIAANRTVLCIFTEFALFHGYRPKVYEYDNHLNMKNNGSIIRK